MTGLINDPVAIFLTIMAVILITPLLSERVRLPGIVGIILGGMLIGPNGLNLLTAHNQIEFLATIGLIYLMFSAGLEVDIQQFNRVRGRAIIFGILTFTIPQLMGMGLGWLLKLNWLGSVLLGSAFASHTLIAFPILMRLGVVRNEAVSVTVGATVMTDIGAFIVLASVLGIQQGNLNIGYFVQLFIFLAIFAVLVLYGLPRLGKLFFSRYSGRTVEFQFVLVVLFVSALVANKIGMHEVVGAFLAGLAINATLPHRSPVIGHVLFMGESFFIPVFLMYSGMITDPTAFVRNQTTILVAIGVTIVAYVSKFVAAWITGRLFHYSRDEFFTAYGLSHAQAAVTIPTLVIGLQQGLFDETLFNAAILMILLTSITSPLIVQRFAPRISGSQPEIKDSPLFHRILVPVINPQTQEHLLTLASILSRAQNGTLLALHVAREVNGQIIDLDQQKEMLGKVQSIIQDPEVSIQLIPRVEQSAAKGILHSAVENDATLIIMGWRGKASIRESVLGTVLDEVVWGTKKPVLVSKLSKPINGINRIVLVLPPDSLSPVTIHQTLLIVNTISHTINVPLVVQLDESYQKKVAEMIAKEELFQDCDLIPLKGNLVRNILSMTNESDLIVLPASGSRKRFVLSWGELHEQLASRTNANVVVLHTNQ